MSNDLDRRLVALADAAVLAEGRLDAGSVARANAVVAKAGARLGFGIENTVVALAGSTGVGKSQLFNALSSSELAAVSRRRPTTSVTQAAVWGDGADPLLDWLEVARRHRLEPGELGGLVLLDLPDFDSIERARTATRSIALSRSPISSSGSSSRRSTPTPPCTSVTYARSHRTQLRWRSLSTSRICLRPRRSMPGGTTWRDSWSRMAFTMSRSWSSRPERGQAWKTYGGCSVDVSPRAGRRSSASRPMSPTRPGHWRARAGAVLPPASTATIETGYSLRSRTPRACRSSSRLWTRRKGVAARLPLDGRSCAGSGGSGLIRCVACGFPRTPQPSVRTSRPEPTEVQRAQVATAARALADRAAEGLPAPWPRLVRDAATQGEDELPDRLDRAVSGTDLHVGRPRWWRAAAFLQRVFAAATIVGMLWLLASPCSATSTSTRWCRCQSSGTFRFPTLLLLAGIAAGSSSPSSSGS